MQINKENCCEKLYKELCTLKNSLESQPPENIHPQICILCCKFPKNVVFLPCGHILICKDCAVNDFEIELCKVFYKRPNSKICLVCKETIKEAREIFI